MKTPAIATIFTSSGNRNIAMGLFIGLLFIAAVVAGLTMVIIAAVEMS